MLRRMGGGVARDGVWSSTTWTLGRWVVKARLTISGCAAELTISAMRSSILENLAWKRRCGTLANDARQLSARAELTNLERAHGFETKYPASFGGDAARWVLATTDT